MFISRLKLVAVVMLAVLAPGAVLWSYAAQADQKRDETPTQTQAAAAAPGTEQAKVNQAVDKPQTARTEAVIPIFIKALKDSDDNIRRTAGRALMHLGPAAVPALVRVFKGHDQKLTIAAIHVVAGMQRQGSFSDTGLPVGTMPTPLHQALEHVLLDKNILAEVIRREDRALTGESEFRLGSRLVDYYLLRSVLGANGVPALIEFLKGDDAQLRRETIRLLGFMGEKAMDALPTLTEIYSRATELDERRALLDAISNIAAPAPGGPFAVPGRGGGKGKAEKGKGGD